MKMYLQIPAVAMPVWAAAGAAWAHGAAGDAGGKGDHPHMWDVWGWVSMFVHPLLGILMIPVIAVAIILVVRAIGRGAATDGPDGATALDILDERFARGGIDIKEYEDNKKILTGG